jgi:probable phosphoglycerate mutase
VVAMVTQELWLVRHGETDWSVDRKFCGWSDPPLNERGRAQARALRPLLAGTHFGGFVSSTSARAVETARLARGEPSTDERLRELDFGELEGLTWADCTPDMHERLLDYERFAAPNGEAVSDLMTRVAAALGDLGDGRHLVVTHGGVIRGLLGRAGIVDYPQPGSLHRVRVTFASGTEIAVAQEEAPPFGVS